MLPVLGRLYVEAGQPLLAERCLAAARSHDPGSAATWEAMGSLAALSPQGEPNLHNLSDKRHHLNLEEEFLQAFKY